MIEFRGLEFTSAQGANKVLYPTARSSSAMTRYIFDVNRGESAAPRPRFPGPVVLSGTMTPQAPS